VQNVCGGIKWRRTTLGSHQTVHTALNRRWGRSPSRSRRGTPRAHGYRRMYRYSTCTTGTTTWRPLCSGGSSPMSTWSRVPELRAAGYSSFQTGGVCWSAVAVDPGSAWIVPDGSISIQWRWNTCCGAKPNEVFLLK
jgi:hypothetical protein